MKRVILTSGPRGSGKTTYVESFLRINPEVKSLSRDGMLVELFGRTSINPYTGDHEYVHQTFLERIKEILDKSGENIEVVADYWNGWSSERRSLVGKFRDCGADRVICWKFVTPPDVCFDWFMKKSDVTGSPEHLKGYYEYDYELYHKTSENIEEDGFDKVYLINPLQLELFG